MAVHDIAYVELYTRNKITAVDYFVSAMGFARVADSVEVDRSSVLLVQGEVRLVVTSGRGVWRFLDEHGEGVADVAMVCDDVGATCKAALAAGATPGGSSAGNLVVSGFGGVTHTLLPDEAGRLPHGRTWVPTPGPHTRPVGHVEALDHVAVCLEGGTLEVYADYYEDAFGFCRYSTAYITLGGQAMDSVVVRSASGRVIFTLVATDPGKEPGQLDAFLERNGGPGVQHLAFRVAEILPAVHELRERGVEFLATPTTYYDMLVERLPDLRDHIEDLRGAQVLADRDEWGQLLQVFSRSPYERNTLFYEFIERRGSRGFGSANIRALYEAVERDRRTAG